MNYYLMAAAYFPTDIKILECIENLVKERNWSYVSEEARQRINDLQNLRAKPTAEYRLPELRKELLKTQKDLADLKKNKGFFSGFKIDDTEDKIKKLKDEILKYEKIMGYSIST